MNCCFKQKKQETVNLTRFVSKTDDKKLGLVITKTVTKISL